MAEYVFFFSCTCDLLTTPLPKGGQVFKCLEHEAQHLGIPEDPQLRMPGSLARPAPRTTRGVRVPCHESPFFAAGGCPPWRLAGCVAALVSGSGALTEVETCGKVFGPSCCLPLRLRSRNRSPNHRTTRGS